MPQSITQYTKISRLTPTPASENDTRASGVSIRPGKVPTSHDKPLREQLGREAPNTPAVAAAAEFLTVKEIAAEMRLGLSSVTRLVKQGRIGAINVSTGRRPTYRVPRVAYDEFKKNCAMGEPKAVAKPSVRLPAGVELFV